MGKFYINVESILKDYAVDLKVWDADKLQSQMIAGVQYKPSLDEIKPDFRQEPVLPANSRTSILGNLLGAGTTAQFDMIWFSTAEYPLNSVVQVLPRTNTTKNDNPIYYEDNTSPKDIESTSVILDEGLTKYRVLNKTSYRNYSDLTIYELKGDAGHDSGY